MVIQLANLFGDNSFVPAYLQSVVRIHEDVLGADLLALYLHGSAVQGDYRPGSSDIDLFGIVSGPIDARRCEQLIEALKHENLPVPAFGLELILSSHDAVREPAVEMPYTFALSTGLEWGAQVETYGTTSDILVHMQLCRKAGLTLFGPPAIEAIPPIELELLRAGLMGEMLWHRDDLQTNPSVTDTSIVNAVLNAARSLWASEHGDILSKTEGGEWWASRHPEDQIVVDALHFRRGRTGSAPTTRSALDFVERAIRRI